jgi:soluble lytic murein transglycosylase-like protein
LPQAKHSPSCAGASAPSGTRSRTNQHRRLAAALLGALALIAAPGGAGADQQRDPELRAVVAKAIAEAQCFTDQYDSAVWYTLMEPRLRNLVKEKDERIAILRQVYCETHRAGESRLPPGLVMAVIAVESRFDRWAVSSAGAVGLMQVMPFWPERLGMRRYELVHVEPNIRMGCAILRFYLGFEHNDVRKALARYNGSPGKRDYPDLVLTAWTHWGGADDLGFSKTPAAGAAR